MIKCIVQRSSENLPRASTHTVIFEIRRAAAMKFRGRHNARYEASEAVPNGRNRPGSDLRSTHRTDVRAYETLADPSERMPHHNNDKAATGQLRL